MQTLDDTDRAILRLMQQDPALTAKELSGRVGASAAACWRRIDKLESAGVIRGRHVLLDTRALGYAVEVSLRVTLDKTDSNAFDSFIASARAISSVNEIQTFLGRVDVRLNVLARDMADYQRIYREEILRLPHITDIEALMLVSTVMDREALPL